MCNDICDQSSDAKYHDETECKTECPVCNTPSSRLPLHTSQLPPALSNTPAHCQPPALSAHPITSNPLCCGMLHFLFILFVFPRISDKVFQVFKKAGNNNACEFVCDPNTDAKYLDGTSVTDCAPECPAGKVAGGCEFI